MSAADPVDRLVGILDGFRVESDDLGALSLVHVVCRTTLAGPDDNGVGGNLGGTVRDAVMHTAECPGPPPSDPAAVASPKPCGGVHAGPCEVLSREDIDGGELIRYRHADGEGVVFNGVIDE